MPLWLVGGGYVLGSILPAEWIAKKHMGLTPQQSGMNPGTVSAWKLFGFRVGLMVLLIDLVKGVIPVALAGRMEIQGIWYALVAASPVIGHNWPLWRRRGGGQGVATVTGALLWLGWWPMLLAYLVGAFIGFIFLRWLPAVVLVALPLGYLLMHVYHLPQESLQVASILIVLVGVRRLPWIWGALRRKMSKAS